MTLLIAVAAPWAAGMTIGGLWLAVNGPQRWPAAAEVLSVAGITVIAAGQFIFLVCVADRICPKGARSLGAVVELPICVIVLLGTALLLWHAVSAFWTGGHAQ